MLRATGRSPEPLLRSTLAVLCGLLLAQLLAALPAFGQGLAFRSFSVGEGVAHERVNCILRDRRGYVWLGTWEGLCRFDGRRFTSYGPRDGLPNPVVVGIAEDARGGLWIATHGGGLARFANDPPGGEVANRPIASSARKALLSFSPGETPASGIVHSLAFDTNGRLWCSTEAGFFRAELDALGTPRFERVPDAAQPPLSSGICFQDGRGAIVLLTTDALVRTDGDRTVTHPRPAAPETGDVVAVEHLAGERWLVAHDHALFECELGSDPESVPTWRRDPLELPADSRFTALARSTAGEVWIGTSRGLVRRSSEGERWLGTAEGLADDRILCLFAEPAGTLWIGTQGSGALRLADESVARYGLASGEGALNIARVVEASDGTIYASSEDRGLFRLRADRLEPVLGTDRPPFSTAHMRVLCDRRGAWWIGTGDGLYRAPGPEPDLARAARIWPAAGEEARGVFAEIREERDGSVRFSGSDYGLYRIEDPASSAPEVRASPCERNDLASPVRVTLIDRAGDEWLATYDQLLVRRAGALELIEHAPGWPEPPARPRALFEDSRGRLWIGTRFSGVRMCEDPGAQQPSFRAFTSADGLASDAVWSIAEDARGRLYFASSLGLARLDPRRPSWITLGAAEGAGREVVNHVLCDRRGLIWAGTSSGLARIDPERELPPPGPPAVHIASVLLSGERLELPERGAQLVRGIVVEPGRENIVIEYSGLDLPGAPPLRFEHVLEGAEAGFGPPSPLEAVHYPRLAAGSYRFIVRAIDGEGRASAEPAVVELRVLAPLWRRPWFLVSAVAALAALGFAWHRARLRRVLALERIRTQIATDLHDDLGSGSAQIAILSEVARRGSEPALAARLDELAQLARSMRQSMGEIVWAIDPRKDKLGDLVRRMRQASANLLEAEGLEVEFDAPPEERMDAVGLDSEQRRQLLLFFKEAALNVARHARATRVWVRVELGPRHLALAVRDDGCGFDPAARSEGQGLASLRRRAQVLGAELEIRSAPGHGTELALALGPRRRRRNRAATPGSPPA